MHSISEVAVWLQDVVTFCLVPRRNQKINCSKNCCLHEAPVSECCLPRLAASEFLGTVFVVTKRKIVWPKFAQRNQDLPLPVERAPSYPETCGSVRERLYTCQPLLKFYLNILPVYFMYELACICKTKAYSLSSHCFISYMFCFDLILQWSLHGEKRGLNSRFSLFISWSQISSVLLAITGAWVTSQAP